METPILPQRGSFLAKLGAWLQLAQLIGLVGTVTGMMKAYQVLGTSGTTDPARLKGAIGEVLSFTAAGVIIASVGLLLVLITSPSAAIVPCGCSGSYASMGA